MIWNEEKVLANIRTAATDDLLDRITAYRQGMEPAAIVLVQQELAVRGVSQDQIAQQLEEYQRECLFEAHGLALMCSFCRKPAVKEAWAWHKLWHKIPLFLRRFRYCKAHCEPAE